MSYFKYVRKDCFKTQLSIPDLIKLSDMTYEQESRKQIALTLKRSTETIYRHQIRLKIV